MPCLQGEGAGSLRLCFAAGHLLVVQDEAGGQRHLRRHAASVTAVCAAPGMLASADAEGCIVLWSPESLQPLAVLPFMAMPEPRPGPVAGLRLLQLPDCQLLLVLHSPGAIETALADDTATTAGVQQQQGAVIQRVSLWSIAPRAVADSPGPVLDADRHNHERQAGSGLSWQLLGTVPLPPLQEPAKQLAACIRWPAEGGGTAVLELAATTPQQVAFAELQLSFGQPSTSQESSNAQDRGLERERRWSPSLLGYRTYIPAVQSAVFRRRVAPFSASAFVPETAQVGGLMWRGQGVTVSYRVRPSKSVEVCLCGSGSSACPGWNKLLSLAAVEGPPCSFNLEGRSPTIQTNL